MLKRFSIADFLAIILAVFLQIQITLFADENYFGLRVNLADLLLPFAGVFVLYSLLTGKSNWPRYSISYAYLWLVSLVAVMSAALINGYIVNGFLSSWAFVNKYIGFFILIAYFLLGGWIVTNAKDAFRVFSLFTGAFVAFFTFCVILSMAGVFLQPVTGFLPWISDYPWEGFMANRNAFMVCFVMSFIFVIWSYRDERLMIFSWVRYLFFVIMPMFFVFNASRTGWIVAAVLLVILFLREPVKRMKLILPFLLLGVLVACLSYYTTKDDEILQAKQARYLLDLADGGTKYYGDQKRYIAVEDGLELYSEYNPLVGAGLGSYKPFQIAKRGEFIDIMDFTALWLLVETGAVGLLVFAAFFIACAWAVYKRGYLEGVSSYHRAIFAFLIAFAAMSVLHELTYTRFLWFALGLAVAHNMASNMASNMAKKSKRDRE